MEQMKPMRPMKPMQPMQPMQEMKPMKPMAPMPQMDSQPADWWPEGLSQPGSSGAQDGLRYAFFPQQRRLAIERNGRVTQYDTGEHRIKGVSQQRQGSGGLPRFTSQHGEVDLGSLRQVG